MFASSQLQELGTSLGMGGGWPGCKSVSGLCSAESMASELRRAGDQPCCGVTHGLGGLK